MFILFMMPTCEMRISTVPSTEYRVAIDTHQDLQSRAGVSIVAQKQIESNRIFRKRIHTIATLSLLQLWNVIIKVPTIDNKMVT